MFRYRFRFLRAFSLAAFAAILIASQSVDTAGAARYRLEEADSDWVASTLRSMSLRDKIAQLIQTRVRGEFVSRDSAEFRNIQKEIRENHVGGVILFAGNVFESALLLNELQQTSTLPLIVSADFERGAAFRITDTTSFPWTMAIGATGSEDFAYQEGAITAREARALGVHWILAPVMDVNNNPENPVINIRSFGEDPALVARLGAAFIRGAQDNGVLATAKHFPGHGDTATDSHVGLPVLTADQARLDSLELVPFKSAIAAGVSALMTAHVAVPQVTGDPRLPATLSPKILSDLLRRSLNFDGLIVTDAMEMAAITKRYFTGLAAVRAIEAGADIILLPPDTSVAINEVERAVKRGDISEERINESVERVLAAKTRLGLHRRRTVALGEIGEVVATPENKQLAQEMADRSITLLRDKTGVIPIDPRSGKGIFSLVLSTDQDASPGAVFQSEMRRRFMNLATAGVDTRTPQRETTTILRRAMAADVIVCATLVRLISGRSARLTQSQRRLLDRIFSSGKPVIWVSFGNPYVLRIFPHSQAYLCTFSYSDVSQVAAAKALSGAIAITGRMPVGIPGSSQVGEGMQIAKLDTRLKSIAAHPPVPPRDHAFAETRSLLASLVERRISPGAALVVGHSGSVVLDTSVGHLDFSPTSPMVTGETMYDLDSLSQAVGTTSAAMLLTDSEKLLLDAPVQEYLPDFLGPDKEKVSVRDLLSHSSGLPATLPYYEMHQGYDEILRSATATPLEFSPHARAVRSDVGMILLGEIIDRAAGFKLNRFLTDSLFVPLGMSSTCYLPAQDLLERIAPSGYDQWRGRAVQGEVRNENAYAMGGVAGNAGLFSSAHDLAVFAQMLLNNGFYDHRWYWKPEILTSFTSTRDSQDRSMGLGWTRISTGSRSGHSLTSSAFGHDGATGASLWIDPGRQLFIVFLTNADPKAVDPATLSQVRKSLIDSIVTTIF